MIQIFLNKKRPFIQILHSKTRNLRIREVTWFATDVVDTTGWLILHQSQTYYLFPIPNIETGNAKLTSLASSSVGLTLDIVLASEKEVNERMIDTYKRALLF